MTVEASSPVLDIRGLGIAVAARGAARRRIVDDVSLSVERGHILALVGESGSGKTMIGRSVLGLLPDGLDRVAGDILLSGSSILGASPSRLRQIRGGDVGMVFQEPMSSLNPAMRIGAQMIEALTLHRRLSRSEARALCIEMLARVGIADPVSSFDALPGQFSGGMRQRIMLASVLATRPKLLIADEPTTALDAIVRKQVMDVMVGLTRDMGTAVLLISHDLGLVSQYADNVVVMRHGKLIESGSPDRILLDPRHDYTSALVGALPARAPARDIASTAEPLLRVENLSVEYARPRRLFSRRTPKSAVEGVTFDVRRAETLGVVGESGSGKSTIGRTIMRLIGKSAGAIHFDGHSHDELTPADLARFRACTQMVFQDPYSSLDPRMRLVDAVAEGLRSRPDLDRAARRRRALNMLVEVGLSEDHAHRFPHELSGGQRQRVCIARAVVAEPLFVVADEPVSALDVTVQHQVLALLERLQAKYGFTMMFISHDLGVVEQISDRVAVMYRGQLVELGSRDAVFDRPHHPYTRRLLVATPRLRRRAEGGFALETAELPDAPPPSGKAWSDPGSGRSGLEMVLVGPGHWASCVDPSAPR